MPAGNRQAKDEAAKLLRKGKYNRALGLYQSVVENDPDDFSARRNVGQILRKLGRQQEAIEVFLSLASDYADDGFLLKAIATCKVVLEIDPHHKQIQARLAELYSNQACGPKPTLKVLVEGEWSPASSSHQDEASELPSGEAEEFQVQRSTPLEHLHDQNQPVSDMPDYMEMVELEPMGVNAIELDLDDPLTKGIESDSEPAVNPAAATAIDGSSDAGATSDDLDIDAIDVDIELDFDLDSQEPARDKQVQSIPEIPLFCELESQAFIALLEQMNMLQVKPGQWILREGEQGSSMFTIAAGKVRILKRLAPKKLLQLAILGEGAFFGEMSLLFGDNRGASVQAIEAGQVFEISRDLIDAVIAEHPSVEDVLNRFSHQRLLRNVMLTAPLFKPFKKKERIELIERFVSREVEKGQVVVQEGVESDGLYLLLRGKMEVFCETEDKQVLKVGELTEGELFGEISCLRKDPAIASVRALCNSSVLRLAREDFDALVMSRPLVLEHIAELGEVRIAKTTRALAQKGVLI